jgi:hypothetical protein
MRQQITRLQVLVAKNGPRVHDYKKRLYELEADVVLLEIADKG